MYVQGLELLDIRLVLPLQVGSIATATTKCRHSCCRTLRSLCSYPATVASMVSCNFCLRDARIERHAFNSVMGAAPILVLLGVSCGNTCGPILPPLPALAVFQLVGVYCGHTCRPSAAANGPSIVSSIPLTALRVLCFTCLIILQSLPIWLAGRLY